MVFITAVLAGGGKHTLIYCHATSGPLNHTPSFSVSKERTWFVSHFH